MLARRCPHCGQRGLYRDRPDVVCYVCGYREPEKGNAFVRCPAEEHDTWPYPARMTLGDDNMLSEVR